MRRRTLYALMFGVPALLAAALFSLLLFALATAVFWLFIFGDNTWPEYAHQALIALPVVACIVIWYGLMTVAYDAGRKAEAKPELNRRHVAMALGITVALVALVFAFQQGQRALNPPTPEGACADLCRDKGFMGSGMPPRNTGSNECSCFDAQGRTALTIELPATAPRR